MKIKRAIGIDLGTTNSAAAMMSPEGSDLWLLEDRFKRKTIPSMVGWELGKQDFMTGWEAWNRRVMEPAPIASIKRKMGTQQTVKIGPHAMTPEEVSAKILGRLVRDLKEYLASKGEEYGRGDEAATFGVDAAVITVPAYFDAPQIEATRRAGELAGLRVVSLLQEPTAAAMYHAWKHGIGDGTFLVYDLGGGTFDVSVIRCLMGEYQVVGIDGDNYLGGDDLDRRLAEYIRQALVAQGYALDLDIQRSADDLTRFKLLVRVAQEVKEALSTTDVQYVGRHGLFEDQAGNPVSIDMEISRAQFEDLIRDLIEQSVVCCNRALARAEQVAGVTLAQIDHVLLVGGSTRVPLVQRLVAEAFCGAGKSLAAAPMQDEPDTCVALGAAIHAANVAGLVLSDEVTGATLTLSSMLTTKESEGRIVGRYEGPDLDVIESVALINQAGDVAALARPEREGNVLQLMLEGIALPDEGRYWFELELCDEEGEPVVAFPVGLVRLGIKQMLRSTGSALSNPSVLAKDITLEVVRDGRAQRQLLIGTGTSLPTEGRFRFYTADRSGAVLLRLFQNRFPIRTIHLSVPADTPVGTPVDLVLKVDETMAMVASGEVLGQSFWAQIEPPPAREALEWEQIEQLLERVDSVGRALWGNEARYFREATDMLVAGIRETARTDPDKLQVLVSRLEEAMEDYHNRERELTPGYGRFALLLDTIKRVIYRQEGTHHLGMSQAEWGQRLKQIEAAGESAFEARDQPAWSKVFNQVQAIWESLAQDEYLFVRTDPAEYVRRLYGIIRRKQQELDSELAGFEYSGNPETREVQQREVGRLREELASKVEVALERFDPDSELLGQQRAELDRLYEVLGHLERQLEKLPTLGLVRQ
jgi:molecular chaperone DnaK